MMHHAGLDWGGQHHQLAIVDNDGHQILNQRLVHDVAGVTALLELLDEFHPHGVAIERAEGLLVEALQAAGHTVYPVSPRVSARARERHQAAARKNDRFDAFVLADTLRTDGHRWRPLAMPSPLLAELRAVVRHRRQAVAAHLRVSNKLQACVDAYNPALGQVFSAIDRDATLALIRRYPTPEKAARITPDRMERFCNRIGYSGRVGPSLLHRRLHDNLLAGGNGSIDGHAFAATLLVDQLEILTHQVKRYDDRIAILFGQHPDRDVFASFPAVGPVIGPELLTEIGEDRNRFPHVEHLLAEAGLAPVTLASGRVQRVRIRRACNRRLRATCNSWSFILKRDDPTTRERYQRRIDKGQHKHAALRAVGAPWMRMLWRCWQDHATYDPTRRRTNQPI